MKWRTRDGRVLEVRDMETRHLYFTHRMLERAGVAEEPFAAFVLGPPLGEMALEAWEHELLGALEMAEYLSPVKAEMRGELESRGVDPFGKPPLERVAISW